MTMSMSLRLARLWSQAQLDLASAAYNKVRGNNAKNAGKDSFVLDHYSSKSPGGAPEADSLGYSNSGGRRGNHNSAELAVIPIEKLK